MSGNNENIDTLMSEVRAGFGGIRASMSSPVDIKGLNKTVIDLSNGISALGKDFVQSKQQSADAQNQKWVNKLKVEDQTLKQPVNESKSIDSRFDKIDKWLDSHSKNVDLLSKIVVPDVKKPVDKDNLINIKSVGDQIKQSIKEGMVSKEPVKEVASSVLKLPSLIEKESEKPNKSFSVKKEQVRPVEINPLKKPLVESKPSALISPTKPPIEQKPILKQNDKTPVSEKTTVIYKEAKPTKSITGNENVNKFKSDVKEPVKTVESPKIAPVQKILSDRIKESKVISEVSQTIKNSVISTIKEEGTKKPVSSVAPILNNVNPLINKPKQQDTVIARDNAMRKVVSDVISSKLEPKKTESILAKSDVNTGSNLRNRTVNEEPVVKVKQPENKTSALTVVNNNIAPNVQTSANKEVNAISRLKTEGKVVENKYLQPKINAVNKSLMTPDNVSRQPVQQPVNLATSTSKVDSANKVADMQLNAKIIAMEILNVITHPTFVANQTKMVERQSSATTKAILA